MLDTALIDEQSYIVAASRPNERSLVLKEGNTFGVFDETGDIRPAGLGEQGLYHEGTRFLSRYVLTLGKSRPLLLSSTVREDNVVLAVDLTNPDIADDHQVVLQRGTVHFYRRRFLWRGVCYERLKLLNYGLTPVEIVFDLQFDSDFHDIFEVRGQKRARGGERLPPETGDKWLVLGYRGLDGVKRCTRIEADTVPQGVNAGGMRFVAPLDAKGEFHLGVSIACETGDEQPCPAAFAIALADAAHSVRQARGDDTGVQTSNREMNVWLKRSRADLGMMVTLTPEGPYPYAGVPWFSTPFGRDALITALFYLWIDPGLARGVLSYLAHTQARELNPEREAEPGKILHESRCGEMANLKEIAFDQYYGSVDSTPLFLLLAGAYYERTADLEFLRSLWPNIEMALRWVDQYGDADGDGFLEYSKHSEKGLIQQGWKDSNDSVFHDDGHLAEAPIALCEVQAYVHAAKLKIAVVAAALGHEPAAIALREQAAVLRRRFEERFWSDSLQTYALALDGRKNPCRVRSSNAGHCLFGGIASPERARSVCQSLVAPESYSGWGIRTLAASEVRYNPMSYHNGSVWPHDNAMILAGFDAYGLKEPVARVLTDFLEASLFFELRRLPELFCGFERRVGKGPTRYPVACSPQAWASATVFSMLQACLGLRVDATRSRISFHHPVLPETIEEVQILNLRLDHDSIDIALRRHETSVGVYVTRREGDVEVVVVK